MLYKIFITIIFFYGLHLSVIADNVYANSIIIDKNSKTIVPWDINESDINILKESVKYAKNNNWGDSIRAARRAKDNSVYKLIQWVASYEDDLINSDQESNFKYKKGLPWKNKKSFINVVENVVHHDEEEEDSDNIVLESYGYEVSDVDNAVKWRISHVNDLFEQQDYYKVYRFSQKLPIEYKKLVAARLAFRLDMEKADIVAQHVSNYFNRDFLLLYDKVLWLKRNNHYKKAINILINSDINNMINVNTHKWWQLKKIYIRDILYNKNVNFYNDAYRLSITNHYNLSKKEALESKWLSGFIALNFINKPDVAYKIFCNMHKTSKLYLSLSRAAYWAGRSAEKIGEHSKAHHWYSIAGNYDNSFYGQVALLRIKANKPISLFANVQYNSVDYESLTQNIAAKLMYIALRIDNKDLAITFMKAALHNASGKGEVMLLIGILIQNNAFDMAIRCVRYLGVNEYILPSILYSNHMKEEVGDIVEPAFSLAVYEERK